MPLKAAKKLGFKLHNPASTVQLQLGILVFVLFTLIGIFGTDTYTYITEDPNGIELLIKGLMRALPFGLGVSLNILFLIPRAFQNFLGSGFIGVIVSAFASGLAMGIGWMFHTLLTDL